MYELKIERRFFASHALRLYDGSFEPLHAHDWVVEVAVRAVKLDAIEVVMDFHELERIVGAALDPMRGANLNCGFPGYGTLRRDERISDCGLAIGNLDNPQSAIHNPQSTINPTAERVAEYLYGAIAGKLPKDVELVSVTVTESPGCRAVYRK